MFRYGTVTILFRFEGVLWDFAVHRAEAWVYKCGMRVMWYAGCGKVLCHPFFEEKSNVKGEVS